MAACISAMLKRASAALDRDGGRIERGSTRSDLLFGEWTARFAQAKGQFQVFPRAQDLRGRTAAVRSIDRLHARQRVIQRGSVRCEDGGAFSGGGVELLAVALGHSRMPEFFEHRERRVDNAGARAIGSGDAIFDLLDDLVAMARTFGNQAQHHQAKLAVVEQAARSAAAPVMTVPIAALV